MNKCYSTNYQKTQNKMQRDVTFPQHEWLLLKQQNRANPKENESQGACGWERVLVLCWWQSKLVQSLWETAWKHLYEWKNSTSLRPSHLISSFIFKWDEIRILKRQAALLTMAQKWKQLKCPSANKGIKKMRHTHHVCVYGSCMCAWTCKLLWQLKDARYGKTNVTWSQLCVKPKRSWVYGAWEWDGSYWGSGRKTGRGGWKRLVPVP